MNSNVEAYKFFRRLKSFIRMSGCYLQLMVGIFVGSFVRSELKIAKNALGNKIGLCRYVTTFGSRSEHANIVGQRSTYAGRQSPCRLQCVQWRVTLVVPQYGTRFMSPFRCLEF
jgi:hypothetical protein